MADEFDWDGFVRLVQAYGDPHQPAPRPLLVPGWLPPLFERAGEDLDQAARSYGFDGFVVASPE